MKRKMILTLLAVFVFVTGCGKSESSDEAISNNEVVSSVETGAGEDVSQKDSVIDSSNEPSSEDSLEGYKKAYI